MRLLLALLLLVSLGETTTAQVIVAGGFSQQSAFGFSVGGNRVRVTGFVGGYTTSGFAGCHPFTGQAWGYFSPAPLVVVVPQTVFVIPRHYDFQGFDTRPAEPKPTVNPKNWHVIRPEKQPMLPVVARPALPPANPPVAAADRDANPQREAARQVRLAQAAFAADEYGRAIERLQEAIKANPDEPLSHFLLAQVRFARGEYAESAEAIRDGLKLAPDWPASAFTPKPLYAANPKAFDEQLAEVRRALADDPADATLQFVLGYQLWFHGDRDAATKLFRRVLPLVKENAMVEAFLNVADLKLVKN